MKPYGDEGDEYMGGWMDGNMKLTMLESGCVIDLSIGADRVCYTYLCLKSKFGIRTYPSSYRLLYSTSI